MLMNITLVKRWGLALALVLCASASAFADSPIEASKSRVVAALQNIMTLDRAGQDGYATVWDGNKYVQCGRLFDRSLRCEAAGALMQPSLEHVLASERVSRLAALGWRFDPRFGNYIQDFPTGTATTLVGDKILQVLAEVYDADVANLEVNSIWVKSEPCPPRNGPSQNLAGMINDAPSMARYAVHACAYTLTPNNGPSVAASSAAELINLYGVRVTGEIQRLRVNLNRDVFVIFEAGIGYIQCHPDTSPPAIYCEAQSADSWEALRSILTPERVARLHAAGFIDPGRAPNYWKSYSLDQMDDQAIAGELLTILHDVYGYTGLPKIQVITERTRQ
jgi:type III secretion system-like peptide-binding chaperone